MSLEARVTISRLIVATIFIISIISMVLGNFFTTLIAVSGGLVFWLLYLVAADLGVRQTREESVTPLGKSLSMVVAGLGGILAISTFLSYGLELTMWGGYAFDVAGIALTIAVLVLTLLPLLVYQLVRRPADAPPAAIATPPVAEAPPAQPSLDQAQPIYYGAPYYPEYGDYAPPQELEYEAEGEEWMSEDEYEESDELEEEPEEEYYSEDDEEGDEETEQ
ncbi:hypothetical protein ACFL45_01265 [Candidatus Neomarinimicrobiota bacterium]